MNYRGAGRRRGEQEIDKLFEIISKENFLNFVEGNNQVQEARESQTN